MAIPVPNYPNYSVYSDGRVWSDKTHKFLKPAYTKRGYASIELFDNGKRRRVLIHRLVANAYIPNPNKFPQVNHKDENPRNNNVNNLEWCTAKYNMSYGEGAKTRSLKIDYTKPIFKETAIKNGKKAAKPVSMYSSEGQYIHTFESAVEASRQTGIYKTNISRATKSHLKAGGYIWKLAKEE